MCFIALRYALLNLRLPVIQLTGENLSPITNVPSMNDSKMEDAEVGAQQAAESAEPGEDGDGVGDQLAIDFELMDGETALPIDIGICLTFCQVCILPLILKNYRADFTDTESTRRLTICWCWTRSRKNWPARRQPCTWSCPRTASKSCACAKRAAVRSAAD